MEKWIKRPLLLLGLAVLSAILHNVLSGLFDVEESIFFSLTLLFALAFIISLNYNFFTFVRKRRAKEKESRKHSKKEKEKIKERLRNLGYW